MKKLLLIFSLILGILLTSCSDGGTSVKSSTNNTESNVSVSSDNSNVSVSSDNANVSVSSDNSNVSVNAQKNADEEAENVIEQLLSE